MCMKKPPMLYWKRKFPPPPPIATADSCQLARVWAWLQQPPLSLVVWNELQIFHYKAAKKIMAVFPIVEYFIK